MKNLKPAAFEILTDKCHHALSQIGIPERIRRAGSTFVFAHDPRAVRHFSWRLIATEMDVNVRETHESGESEVDRIYSLMCCSFFPVLNIESEVGILPLTCLESLD